MKGKLFYLSELEARMLRSVIAWQLKKYDIPQRYTSGRETLKHVMKRLSNHIDKQTLAHKSKQQEKCE